MVNQIQFKQMKKALGFDNSNESYRNKYYVYEIDEVWEELIKLGLAKRSEYYENSDLGKIGYWYSVTDKGTKLIMDLIKSSENRKVRISKN